MPVSIAEEMQAMIPASRPTAARPLLGLTILVVEDSRYACEALRLMCLHSGARMRRADCLKSADRHLRAYRPDALIVDLGLPDGSGLDLIARVRAAAPGGPRIIACSGDPDAGRAALAAGADDFLAKPLGSLAGFQATLLGHLPGEEAGDRGARVPAPDPLALSDDLGLAAARLAAPQDKQSLAYLAQFVGGIAMSTEDAALAEAAESLARDVSANLPADGSRFRLQRAVSLRIAEVSPI